jgi:DNA-binding response OmpR family regulator
MNILLVEDEIKIADFIVAGFDIAGFTTRHVHDGKTGLELALATDYDAIVLDLMLPGMDGMSVLKKIRQANRTTPVIILTAKSDLQDRLDGFEAGADDYLPKPFFVEELVARIRLLIARRIGQVQTIIRENGFELNRLTREASWAGYQATLSQREFTLMEYLMRSPDHIFSRTQILKHVWGYDFDPKTNVVDVYVQRIRKKLNHPREKSQVELPVESVRGIGYRFNKISA